jgi:HAMP domain-containing protein
MSFYLNPKNWPITLKISLALLSVSLIPAIFIAYYNLNGSWDTVEKSEYRNLQLLAGATAERLDQLMTDNAIAASQLSSDTEIISLLSNPENTPASVRDSISGSLDRILESNPQYEYVYLLDKDGKAVISKQIEGMPSVQGQNFSDRAYYFETMKGKAYIDVLVGRTSKKLGFYFSSPVYGALGKPVGIAIIKLKGEAITDIVNKFKAGNTGYAFLVDQDGVIVSYPDPKWLYTSFAPLSHESEMKAGQRFVLPGCENPQQLEGCKVRSLNLPSLSDVVSGNNSNARNATYISPLDKTERIVGVANTKQLNWSVVVDETKSDFTMPLAALARQSVVSVLVIGTLAVIAGILLARLITQPLEKLTLAAQAVEAGDIMMPETMTSIIEQGDEVGRLALVFSNMLTALNTRVTELYTINMVTRKISSSYNIGNTLTIVLNAVRNVVPYDRAVVLLYDPIKTQFCTRATGDGRGFYLNRVWNEVDRPAIHARNEGILGQYFEKRNRRNENISLLVPDISLQSGAELNYQREWGEFVPKSYLGMPLLYKDEIVGVIELVSDNVGRFNPDHARVLELIAGQLAVAVRNALDVENRESELRKQIDELQIVIDESRKQKSVEEIVESDFFQELTSKAAQIRQKRQEKSGK